MRKKIIVNKRESAPF